MRSGCLLSIVGAASLIMAGCASQNEKKMTCGADCGTKGCCMDEKPSVAAASFGEPMKLADSDTVPVSRVIANADKYKDKPVRVSGNVKDVCATKGCWMTLADASSKEPLFVKFTCPIDGRLIPMNAVGHTAIAEGTLQVNEISEADARHYAEEAGKSPAEVAKIVGPQKQIRLKSPAARVDGITASSAH